MAKVVKNAVIHLFAFILAVSSWSLCSGQRNSESDRSYARDSGSNSGEYTTVDLGRNGTGGAISARSLSPGNGDKVNQLGRGGDASEIVFPSSSHAVLSRKTPKRVS
jgi:hypothetical protein